MLKNRGQEKGGANDQRFAQEKYQGASGVIDFENANHGYFPAPLLVRSSLLP